MRIVCLSVAVGAAAGAASILLSLAAIGAEALHGLSVWTYAALPVMAMGSVWLYRVLNVPFDMGTPRVIDEARQGRAPSWKIVPAIFLGTASTLIGGGSVGKEAAALQMGAGIASLAGSVSPDERRTLALAGMAGAFSALLFAPIAAFFFVLEVAHMPLRRLLELRPACIALASLVAFGIASALGVGRIWQGPIYVAPFSSSVLDVLVVSFMCAFTGVAFVLLLKLARTAAATFLSGDIARVLIGACAVVAFCALTDASQFSGTGAEQIYAAIAGEYFWFDAVTWKILLTIGCLAFGLKGGEIMPVLCIGALLGSALGGVCGADTSFCAAVGLVALFCTCGRCPLSACALGIEMFGLAGAPAFALAAAASVLAGSGMSLYQGANWKLDMYRLPKKSGHGDRDGEGS